jgi:hypothetical protein
MYMNADVLAQLGLLRGNVGKMDTNSELCKRILPVLQHSKTLFLKNGGEDCNQHVQSITHPYLLMLGIHLAQVLSI